MSRYELAPHATLQQDIQCFWSVEEPLITFNGDDILPDPYRELVINCGAPVVLETGHGAPIELPRAYLNGLQHKPLRLRTTGLCQIVGARFYPWAALLFIDTQANLPNTSIMPLSGVWHDLAHTLEITIRHHGYGAAMHTLQRFVQDQSHGPQLDGALISAARELLAVPHSQPRMHDLATRYYLSLSQFERRFKQAIGVSPKTLARLARFEAICECLLDNPTRRLADLSYSFGYADQAHFIHDFKIFAARTRVSLRF